MRLIKVRRFKKHPLGWTYRVQSATGAMRDFYSFKRDAVIHARVMQKRDGGQWEVYRIHRYGTTMRLIKVVGGYFDDWPSDGDW